MRLVFLGPPGAGKGTQARLLAEEKGWLHLSTGDILRDAVARGTETGLLAKGCMDEGRLVPDGMVDAIVAERLAQDDAAGGWILDGYPRNLAQAEALGDVVDSVLLIAVADEVLVKRILSRGQGRADDTEEVVRERLRVYREHTEPLVGFYRDRGLLREVDGDQAVDRVRADIRAAVEGARA